MSAAKSRSDRDSLSSLATTGPRAASVGDERLRHRPRAERRRRPHPHRSRALASAGRCARALVGSRVRYAEETLREVWGGSSAERERARTALGSPGPPLSTARPSAQEPTPRPHRRRRSPCTGCRRRAGRQEPGAARRQAAQERFPDHSESRSPQAPRTRRSSRRWPVLRSTCHFLHARRQRRCSPPGARRRKTPQVQPTSSSREVPPSPLVVGRSPPQPIGRPDVSPVRQVSQWEARGVQTGRPSHEPDRPRISSRQGRGERKNAGRPDRSRLLSSPRLSCMSTT